MPRFERLITMMWVVGGLALASSATTAHAQEITHGPYLQDLRTDGATVVWEGPGWAGATPSVGFGVAATDENNLPCTCQAAHCWCDITGMQPDVVYLYDIKNGGVEVNEGGTFRTAPDYAKPFKFAVFGDNRSDHSSHQLVIDAMIDDYAFIFNTGDMVSDGKVEAQWQQFFEIETPLLRNVPLYPSVGNHEVDGEDLDIFLRLFHTPAQASGSGEKSYYSYNYGKPTSWSSTASTGWSPGTCACCS